MFGFVVFRLVIIDDFVMTFDTAIGSFIDKGLVDTVSVSYILVD